MIPVPKPPRSLPKPRKPLKKSRIKKRSRPASETRRIYGPPERRIWMKDQNCAACGRWGSSVSAHVLGCEGTGIKKGYTTTAPLCEAPWTISNGRGGEMTVKGCHQLFDEFRWVFDMYFPDFNPEQCARDTEQAYQNYLGEKK